MPVLFFHFGYVDSQLLLLFSLPERCSLSMFYVPTLRGGQCGTRQAVYYHGALWLFGFFLYFF